MATAGLGGAPITKGLMLAGISSSILLQAAATTRRRVPLLVDAFTHVFAFRSTPTELIFGSAMLYYTRLFERLQGSTKYGSFVLVTCAIAYALEAAITAAGGPRASSGLTPLLFANLIPFMLDVPPLHKFSFFGWSMTDKIFIYLAAVQVLFSGHRRSLAAGVCGAVAGLLFRMNFAGMRSFRLPAAVAQLFSGSLGRVLSSPADRHQVFLTPPVQQQQQQAQQVPSGAGVPQAVPGGGAAVQPLPEAVEQLVAMGFDPGAARRALVEANNNVELAMNYLL